MGVRWTGRSKEVDGMEGSREVDDGPRKGRGGLEPPSMGERGGMESEEVEGKDGPERGVGEESGAG